MTIVLGTIAYLQLQVYRQQKTMMESSGSQTDQLIKAANIQAGAANKVAIASEKSAEAAGGFAKSAAGIDSNTAGAVAEFRRIALDAERPLKLGIEASRDDQRAWFGIAGENFQV